MSLHCFEPYPERFTQASSRRYGLLRAGMTARVSVENDALVDEFVEQMYRHGIRGAVRDAFIEGWKLNMEPLPERLTGTLDDDARALDQLVRISSAGKQLAPDFPLRDFMEQCGPDERSLILRALRPLHRCGRVTIENFTYPLRVGRGTGEMTIETLPWVCSEPRTYAKQETPVLDAAPGRAN